jgi:hypothetical protein
MGILNKLSTVNSYWVGPSACDGISKLSERGKTQKERNRNAPVYASLSSLVQMRWAVEVWMGEGWAWVDW